MDARADERAVRGTSSPVLGMVLFVASEAMFFAAFFAVYAIDYSSSRIWPPRGIVVPSLALPSVATALIAASSVSVQLGRRAIRRGDVGALNRWVGATLLLGVGFAVLQLAGYSQVDFGISAGVFGSLFYMMTGIALAHVVGGVVFLVMVLTRSMTGQLTMIRHDSAEAAAIYWHFVVVVSIAIYLAFFVLASVSTKGP
ncbi:MAG: cytochrome c oxidase subunit 3 [Actinomycetota bacterium]|nr:cytochrome c oxidase subunit 3 [Actinomycetota bacterium]